MGFGCTTVAVSTVKDKRKAILLPFIPCSAKAPVVFLVAAVLRLNFFVVFLLYIFCVLIGVVASRAACHSEPQGHTEAKNLCRSQKFAKTVTSNTLQFFKRISGPVLIAATILYFLKTYTFHFQIAREFDDSILYWLCYSLSPIFVPLGLGSPAVIAALAFGILGKELVAATLALFAPASLILSTAAPFGFTTASLFAFVVFFMLYPPCVSAIKATAVQTDNRTAFKSVLLNLTVAYLAAFLVYICLVVVL